MLIMIIIIIIINTGLPKIKILFTERLLQF